MKVMSRLAVFALGVLLPLFISCKGPSHADPSTEFATYIKAYTGGVVPSDASVRIELASDVAETTGGDLFSFSPSLKGTTRWLSPSVVEFTPVEGALSPGTEYKASFKLGRAAAVPSGLEKFVFSFRVAPKSATLSVDGVRISSEDPSKASVSGTVTFSEAVSEDVAGSMLSVSYPGSEPKAEWQPVGDGCSYAFLIPDLERASSDKSLELRLDGSKKGFKTARKTVVTIPAAGSFRVVSADLHEGADPYIDIRFSEPLDASASDKGFITLSNVGRYYTQVDANRARVFFDSMPSEGGVGLKVSSLIKAYDDTRMDNEYVNSFKSSAVMPQVKFAISGNILPDASNLVLPFCAIGLRSVDLSVIKIYEDNVLMFLQDNDLGGDNDMRRSGRMVYKTTVRLDGDDSKDLNDWEYYSVDLSNLFKKEQGAIYRIRLSFNYESTIYAAPQSSAGPLVSLQTGNLTKEEADVWDTPYAYYYDNFYDWNKYDWEQTGNPQHPSYYMESYRFPSINLLTSDIGIIVKSADAGRLWVTVADIISAKPMSGADVTAYNYQLQEVGKARTDANGFADFKTSGKPFVVVVRNGDAVGYLKVVDGEEKSLSRFDTGGKVLSSGLKGFVYGERGVWRPGDTLHVSLLIDDRDKVVPESHPVTMELYNPQGQFYSKQINTSGVKGLYVFNIPTSASDPTGTWNAYFKVGGATFHKSLPIETVKANRLKLNLDTDAKVIKAGAVTPFHLTASWLTGPAASNLKCSSEMTLSRSSTAFKGFEGYTFSDPLSDFSSSSWTLYENMLDDYGRLDISVTMPEAKGAPGMLKANIVTRVKEAGGDESIITQTMPFAPYSAFVGVKLAEDELETDTDLRFPVVVVDQDGTKVSGHNVEYKVFKLDWSWWWESGAASLDSYVNGSSATPVVSGTFTSSSDPAYISFKVEYPDYGRYLVYAKDLSGGHASGGIVFVDWPAWRGRSERSDADGLEMLTFTTDRKSYQVGDDAVVHIPAADGGRALVSMENSRGVISRTWVKTSADADTPYKFAITADMAPNFYVHISLLQPHAHSANDLPIRMYGVQPVLVSSKDSRLEPVLSLPDVIRPQEEFTVTVKESAGRPMTYTLAIVDEGLLDITSFKTPNPWAAMNEREALGVKTWDLYDKVVGAFTGKFSPLLSIGGDEDVQIGNKKDNRFNPVVKFYGPFKLEKGTAKHKVKLPMYVGSVRVMLVAGQNGAYGNAEKTVPVRSPLMILPTLPRVLGTGENVVLPVNVFAMEDDVTNVKLSVSVDGPVSISSSQTQYMTFRNTGDQIARFILSTGTSEGIAKVTVKAESGSYKAEDTISIEVRNPLAPSSSSNSAYLKGGESTSFAFDPFVADDDHWAKLQAANFPAVDFDGLFSYVKSYQYDCTEQLASKGMTLLYTKRFLSPQNALKTDDMVAAALQALYSRQLPDGGFAYWPGNSVANEWATSMAGQFLSEASAQGYAVNKAVIASWKKYQKKASSNYKTAEQYAAYDLQQAYRLYTLALASDADEGAMNRLKAAPEMSVQARWRLAAAYALNGKKNVAKQLIEQLDADVSDQASSQYTYGSSDRDKAMLLETAVLCDEMQLAMELAEEVADIYENGYAGTQYTAFAALAMSRLAEKVGNSAITLELQGAASGELKTAKSSIVKELDPATGTLIVKNRSNDPVYVTLQIRRPVPTSETVPASSSNISVSVKYTDMAGKEVSPYALVQGQDFKAAITVSAASPQAQARTNLALVNIVPSGWEIFNDRLFDEAAQSTEGYTYKDIRDDRVIWYFDLPAGGKKTFAVRLQASYEGEFVLPAVTCEAMYDLDTYASTSSGKSVVAQ